MKRLLAVLVALVLAAIGLSGCQTQSNAPLKVGMELAYPPFEGKDASGNPTGVSVDIAKALGEYLKRPVQIENIAWDGLIPALQSGKVDMVISSMTITDKRKEVVTFSDPYAKAYLAFLVGKDSSAKTAVDLHEKGRTIAVKKGTTGEAYVKAKMPNATVTSLSSENAAVTEVAQNKADAFIYDQLTIYRQSQNNVGMKMVPIPDQQPESWGMAVKKDNHHLVKQINEFLKKFKADGGFDKVTQTHLAVEKKKFDELGFRWFFE